MVDASIKAFGESVVLPSGEAIGEFIPYPLEPGGFGSEVGLTMQLGNQRAPELYLHDADAAGLKMGDQVRVRCIDWLVASPPRPDGRGKTLIELMPASGVGPAPPDQPWR